MNVGCHSPNLIKHAIFDPVVIFEVQAEGTIALRFIVAVFLEKGNNFFSITAISKINSQI